MTQYSPRHKAAIAINVLILLAILAFIFGHSTADQAASSAESMQLLSLLSGLFQGLTEHILRKLAHFCEFAALGFFTAHLSRVCRKLSVHTVFHSLLFGLLCALTDESIQLLNDRSAQVTDVWIDFSGVCCGVLFFLLPVVIHRLWRKRGIT
ncbi:MAG: VanZ family protein [Clostridiales bacterium]|nr:VanZ family protein [Clostridiales bacterium]